VYERNNNRKEKMTKINSNKKGFTIIEVVLVLAIAGLIFMTLPALQRSQRDTQRSNDIARVQTALNNYQANNRGAIPTSGNYVGGHEKPEMKVSTSADTKTWMYFYDNYLIVNSAGAQDVFADPDGSYYSLYIQDCKGSASSMNVGDTCAVGQRFNVTFDEQSVGIASENTDLDKVNGKEVGEKGHAISIVKHATCQGEVATYSTGARKVAILYKKEGGGTFCLNN
jgi:prepilin-type N-terminal cleavage/methylation domain-containing protein